MKNNYMKQRQLYREERRLVYTILSSWIILPLTVSLASPIFNYFDPDGNVYRAAMSLVDVFVILVGVFGFAWMLRIEAAKWAQDEAAPASKPVKQEKNDVPAMDEAKADDRRDACFLAAILAVLLAYIFREIGADVWTITGAGVVVAAYLLLVLDSRKETGDE